MVPEICNNNFACTYSEVRSIERILKSADSVGNASQIMTGCDIQLCNHPYTVASPSNPTPTRACFVALSGKTTGRGQL